MKTIPYLKKRNDFLQKNLSHDQMEAIAEVQRKISNHVYKFIELTCLCGKTADDEDTLLATHDQFGLPTHNILCSKCGLVRSHFILDDASVIDFYSNYYRKIYDGSNFALKDFFIFQCNKGKRLVELAKKYHHSNGPDSTVCEIGCGAGGILHTFQDAGYKTIGVDYDREYLEYGRTKNLDLREGDYKINLDDNSIDVLILTHVMEHFSHILYEVKHIISKVKENGILIIEVPGVFNDLKYTSPIRNFQNAHIFGYFYKTFLEILFKKFSLEILYSNEGCTIVLKKPLHWRAEDIEYIYDESFQKYPNKILKHLIFQEFLSRYNISRNQRYLAFQYVKNILRTIIKTLIRYKKKEK